MRLSLIVTSLRGGGAEAVGIAWARGLQKLGHKVEIIIVSAGEIGEHFREEFDLIELGSRRGHAAKVKALREHLQARPATAVVALQTYPNLVAIAATRRWGSQPAPVVIATEHNLISLGLPGSNPIHRLKIGIAKKVYRFADAVTGCSHAVAAEMVAGFGVAPSRAFVALNPALAKVTNRTLIERVPGTAQGVTIVLAGRLVPQKNPLLSIAVAEVLNRRGIPTRVESFGTGPLLADLTAAAAKSGVEFVTHGWVEDWFAEFPPNAVVLLPSRREGFGNVLVEAAARGVPSVAISRSLGVADAIVPGITGALAATPEPENIADAIIEAADIEWTDVDGWLERFEEVASAKTVTTVIERAIAARDGEAVGSVAASPVGVA